MNSSQDSASQPPAGITTNFERPANLFQASTVYTSLCFAIATICFFVRVYTRVLFFQQAKLHDLFLAITWILYLGYTVIVFLILRGCPRIAQGDVPLDTLNRIFYYFDVELVLYDCIMFFMKLTILLQYIEIFAYKSVNRTMYWLCYFMIFVNFVLYFISVVLEIFVCRGVHTPWEGIDNGYSCPFNILMLNVVVNAFNSVSNITILILPQVSIWNLQLELGKKIGISILFLMGLFACVSSIVHLTYTVIILRGSDNTAYYLFLSALWTYPETSFGIVVACLPVLPKFFREMRQITRQSDSVFRMRLFCEGCCMSRQSYKSKSSKLSNLAFSDDSHPLTYPQATILERPVSISLGWNKSEERIFEATTPLSQLRPSP